MFVVFEKKNISNSIRFYYNFYGLFGDSCGFEQILGDSLGFY